MNLNHQCCKRANFKAKLKDELDPIADMKYFITEIHSERRPLAPLRRARILRGIH